MNHPKNQPTLPQTYKYEILAILRSEYKNRETFSLYQAWICLSESELVFDFGNFVEGVTALVDDNILQYTIGENEIRRYFIVEQKEKFPMQKMINLIKTSIENHPKSIIEISSEINVRRERVQNVVQILRGFGIIEMACRTSTKGIKNAYQWNSKQEEYFTHLPEKLEFIKRLRNFNSILEGYVSKKMAESLELPDIL
ncbi:hypothetical protein TRFO_08810 [Tritrichomonas foetus]|uniref:Uncharacterized protein n=1 Tax=Tritrichomonas foetus TaxID=1144522 RepID=A0A1J4JHB4_9EUKA|nr:hypothetical protein TRFO_08810 [Tritrichomonas foetus]|eukprot:OHS98538.1 hypothetical protein TRFO_08810 [Tritrichomonas foetus]